jgi:hypothetical protein
MIHGKHINIDFASKLLHTVAGNNTMVTIIDSLTKRVRGFVTYEVNLLAENFVTLFIEHYIRAHGISASIILDHDIRFQSDFWQGFTKGIGIRLQFSTVIHHQPDLLAEKVNDTGQMFLRVYTTTINVNAWDVLLTLAEFTFHATVYKVAQVTPFEADLGYVCRLPIDFLLPPEHDVMAEHQEAVSFTDRIQAQLWEICERL